jgi:hypothetical protein
MEMQKPSYYQQFEIVVGPDKDKLDIYKTYLFRVDRGYVAAIPAMSWCFFISDVRLHKDGKEGAQDHVLYWMESESIIPHERAEIAARDIVQKANEDMKRRGDKHGKNYN